MKNIFGSAVDGEEGSMWPPEPNDPAVEQDRACPSIDFSGHFSLHFNSKHFDPRNPRLDGQIVRSSAPFPAT